MRLRAIAYALFYGLVPCRFYEDTPHYAPMGYWRHLAMNLAYAARWAAGRERVEDVLFEIEVNGSEVPLAATFEDGRHFDQPFRIKASAPRRILAALIGRQL